MTDAQHGRGDLSSAPDPDHGAPHGATGGASAGSERGVAEGRGVAAPSPLAEQGGDGASHRPPAADPRAITHVPTHVMPGALHGAPQSAHHGATIGATIRATIGARGAKTPPRTDHRRDVPGEKPDADYVIYRLEEAGATLLALPGTGWSPHLRTSQLEIVRTALEAYGWEPPRARPPVPSAGRITRMDEALDWITLIPRDRYVLRRIVGARALVSPLTERHLFSWRRLAVLLGADHKAVQRWHGEGVRLLVRALGG